jgi:hypothetical protein
MKLNNIIIKFYIYVCCGQIYIVQEEEETSKVFLQPTKKMISRLERTRRKPAASDKASTKTQLVLEPSSHLGDTSDNNSGTLQLQLKSTI